MNTRTIIETIDIKKIYGMGDISVAALDGVSVNVREGEFLAIMGPSGSGKSTLMNILGCLSRPTSGQFILDGEDISDLTKVEMAIIRNQKLGYVFQSYNLLPRTTALQNVMLPLFYDRTNYLSTEEQREKAHKTLEAVGLGDRLYHEPQELSGGEQQRVAIARALVNNPVLIMADEPTGNLDSKSGAEIMNLIRDLNEKGTTVVMVTHDPAIAAYTHRTIHLLDGLVDKEIHNGSSKTTRNYSPSCHFDEERGEIFAV